MAKCYCWKGYTYNGKLPAVNVKAKMSTLLLVQLRTTTKMMMMMMTTVMIIVTMMKKLLNCKKEVQI